MGTSSPSRIVAWCLTCALTLPALAKEPADLLDGPPVVSAKAWAIVDGKTGELLFGKDEDVPAKAASTAKMMNAWVVLRLAEQDPRVMDEVVTVSKVAGTTTGSTAGLKEGERVSVRECLYGLLLPSGNDAGNALAEHFNDRFRPLVAGELKIKLELPKSPRSNFIAEMNREAQRLGMTKTAYRSAFGDGAGDLPTATPRDLLTLARTAMQDERFRRYVSTAEYSGKVVKADGTERVAKWENTNLLLKTEGFDGVKTGTTTAAGSCLVSSNRRGDDHLLCVVLGSGANPGRFVDTRNLLRWAWAERAKRKVGG
ncbi:MAG TPA: serine hydrolase [Tepidisphaeraceae bacterium]|nr:serine hydrolase [Tepidisphaeraceae bacterium]